MEMGKNIFGFRFGDEDIRQAARAGIDGMKGWLTSIGRLLTFTELGIDDSKFETMADDLERLYMRDSGHLLNPRPIDKTGALEIFRMSL